MTRPVLVFLLSSLISLTSYAQVTTPDRESSNDDETEASSGTSASDIAKNYQDLSNHIDEDTDKVKSLYYIKTKVPSDYGGADQTISRLVKPQLYKAGERLRKHYMNQLKEVAEGNYQDKIQILNQVERLNSRLKTLSRKADTKSLEKSLKKVKDPIQIKDILLVK